MWGHICICVQKNKVSSLNMCQGEVCTYDTNANDANTNGDNDGQSMIL